ncbi:glycosyltransferase family 2 protein [Halobacteriota archaeon]
MKIIITIPAYNEEESISYVISGIKKTMDQTEYEYKIIVVNDGSTDNTANIAKSSGALVYSHPYNYGLAETFRTEIEKALEGNAEIIVHIDADGQYRPEEIHELIKPLENKEADLVLGSRFAGVIEKMPFVKKLGNIAFSKVVSQISGIKVTDAQTGFRAFTREIAEKIEIISTHTYTQEQIIKTVRNKFKVKEVPIYFEKRKSGTSRLMSNPVDFAIKAWINLLRIYRDFEPLKFFGVVGFVLIFTAILTFFCSIFFLRELLDITVIVLILAGIQIILFGFLAEMVKKR